MLKKNTDAVTGRQTAEMSSNSTDDKDSSLNIRFHSNVAFQILAALDVSPFPAWLKLSKLNKSK